MKKKILCIDMDNVLFDFDGALSENMYNPPDMYKQGFFQDLKVLPGSRHAVAALLRSDKYDVYICTKPLADSPISYSEKVKSIASHFPTLLHKIIMIQNKAMVRADILIDDHKENIKAFEKEGGKGFLFDFKDSEKMWEQILTKLL